MSGNPYFQLLNREMARHHFYPPLARPLGLKGEPYFDIWLDRGGRLLDLKLVHSSGSQLFDEAGEREIRETAPFPAPPSDLYLYITVGVPFVPSDP